MPDILRFISMFFLRFERDIRKKIVAGISRFVTILFLIFKKGDKQKNCNKFFRIYKYAFFNI